VRNILTPEMAASVFSLDWADERCKVANMTSMVTGLRAGELQGLRVFDLGDDCLLIRHSWNRIDKLKTTKNNSERVVEMPFSAILQSLKYIASLNPHGVSNDSFVFWASLSAKKPMEQKLFTSGLRKSLVASGLNKDAADKFTFHGWRHFFITYMRPKLEDKLLQSQTGHKTIPMLEHYLYRVIGIKYTKHNARFFPRFFQVNFHSACAICRLYLTIVSRKATALFSKLASN
jgi:integrase